MRFLIPISIFLIFIISSCEQNRSSELQVTQPSNVSKMIKTTNSSQDTSQFNRMPSDKSQSYSPTNTKSQPLTIEQLGDTYLVKKKHAQPNVADAKFSDDIARELEKRKNNKTTYEPCIFCSGAGNEQCNLCGGHGGSRVYYGPDDNLGQWIECSGSLYPCVNGKTKCHMCDGTGKSKFPK
jgi:hypothetical protein